MTNLRPNEQRAKNAEIWIWIVLILDIISLFSSYMQYDLIQSVKNGATITMDTANANDARERIIAIIYLIVYAVSGVTFIMWFRRAYYNLHRKINAMNLYGKVNYLSCSEGWAAGAWFVPILNLFRPYQIMNELYVETKRLFVKNGMPDKAPYTAGKVGWWWALWIITLVFGNVILRIQLDSELVDVESLITFTVLDMILSVLMIPLAIITIDVIKTYAKTEIFLKELPEENENLVKSN